MSLWNRLPTEVLYIVLGMIEKDLNLNDNLTNFTLTQCQLTCKTWEKHAQTRIYRSIQLKDPNQFAELLATLSSCESNLGRLVKKVNIDPWEKFSPHIGFLQLLFLKCPNIETVDTISEVTGDIFEQIQKAYERGACRRLRNTPTFDEDLPNAEKQKYLDATYCLCNSLEKLILDEDSVINVKDSTRSLLQSLNEFSNLHTLTIKMKSLETTYQIGKWIEHCRGLNALNLEWYPAVKLNKDMDLAVNSTIPCSTIKELDLDDAPLTENLLEYIIHAFPNLNNFTMDADYVPEITSSISSILWLKFLVDLNTRDFKYLQVQQLYISDIPGVLTDFFHKITANKNLKIRYRDISTINKPYVDVNSFKPSHSGWKDGLDFIVTAVFPVYQDRNEMPHMKLLRTTGGFLRSLEFNTDSPAYSSYLKRNGFFLDSVFQLCPSIVKLTLSSLAISKCNPEQQTNTSIKDLKILECYLLQEVFLELSVRLPSLTNIWLEDLYQLDSHGRLHEECSKYIIEMPHTSFDTLDWVMDSSIATSYAHVNLKIITLAKPYYYLGNEDGTVTETSDMSFQKSWDNTSVFSVLFQCKSIKTFKLKLECRSWRIDFTDL